MKTYKDTAESSHGLLTKLPLMLTSYITGHICQNQEINIGIILLTEP